MSKNTVSNPVDPSLNVTIQLNISVHAESYHRWGDPQGEASFQVTLPVNSFGAIDFEALTPGMLAQAVSGYAVKQAEAQAKAEAETVA